MKDHFENWNTLKQELHFEKERVHFRQGEVWFVSIGQNIGFETLGKGEKFLRPVLIFRKINKSTFLGIPLTSKIKEDKFHFEIDIKSNKSRLIVSQIRTFDAKRLAYKKGQIDKEIFEKVERKIVEFYELTPPRRGGYTHQNDEQRVNEDIVSQQSLEVNTDNPRISIITSVYNNKETITDAIESVLSQTYDNIEYIVIDGASKDGTVEVIERYADRISTFVSEPDRGIYDGLNKGVAKATGDVIAFLHSDDLYADPEVITRVAEAFAATGADAVYGDLVYTPKADTSKVLRYWKSRVFEPELLGRGWMPAHPTFFVRRELYETHGNFDTTFRIAADYDFMLRVLSKEIKTHYLPSVLYKMRVGGESNKSIKNIIKKMREDYRALKNNNIGGIGTLVIKNLSKIPQFFKK